MQNMWDERFSTPEYLYGKEPNQFLQDSFNKHKSLFIEPILMLGDGEGRNGVFLASHNLEVYSLDFSKVALEKAKKLAEEKNTKLQLIFEDVTKFEFVPNYWGSIILIYLHLLEEERTKLYDKISKSLKPGGIFLLEVFSKEQINYQSGGPKNLDLLYSLEELKTNFKDFEIIVANKLIINLNEGYLHKGEGSVIRFLAQKQNKNGD